ncbi:uncharacterized protein LOC134230308 [Saccostrea cucullata]|uniref:uncharacterized protein LOC134230308 n=1 Tax=Saccostrea cuccullata TaxID=36930 RepID=UPI002ED53275
MFDTDGNLLRADVTFRDRNGQECKIHFEGSDGRSSEKPQVSKSPTTTLSEHSQVNSFLGRTPKIQDTCGYREKVFHGDDTAEQFCSYITQKHYRDTFLIAHNAKSFDLYPILEVLIDRHSIRPSKIIHSGSKIMYMHISQKLNLTFLDSLNFLPMKLAKIPEAFGLEELSKGYFPHLFNTKANQKYVGPYPALKYYGYDFMSSEERKKLAEWHAKKSDETFNFQDEMLRYCRSDVDILRRGCLEFRNLMINVTTFKSCIVQPDGTIENCNTSGVDPFDFVTIASVCMGIFKTLFLKEEHEVEITKGLETEWYNVYCKSGLQGVSIDGEWKSLIDLKKDESVQTGKQKFTSPIAVVPSQGYTKRDNHSKISIQWLEWLMEKSLKRGKPVFIRHALNEGEYRVPGTNYRCDGFTETPNGMGTIYEFYGCVFHGCRTCFPHDRYKTKLPSTNQTIDELFTMTKRREQELKDLGYKVVTIWEHQFKYQLNKNLELQQFILNLDLQDRLNPRDSFFGGRTNAIKLHYKAQKGETIQYYDFTSLYPWTNKYCRYPIGHPTIITDNFEDLSLYFGLAKIKKLPPRRLYHPVLPYNSKGKLKFPLCRKCADTENQKECTCSVEDRVIIGTWCTPEIQMATSKGYKTLKIYEVYHFSESSKYDEKSCEGGLFAQYVNMFLKIKQEASAFPAGCVTEEFKRKYIREYREKEGIQLDYEKIQKNPGLRCLAKLCLNSFWGKFGQRLDMNQSMFIHESEAENFFQILSDPTKVPHNFHIVSRDILQLEYSNSALFTSFDNKTNIFLASFTTMWARLKLYSVLDKLNENVLYFDTDSVIFKAKQSDDLSYLPIGNYLGELTNEISAQEGHIVEFVSGGPKNYAYRTLSGKEECKVRGFTLNWANSKLINFDAIKSIICTSKQIEIINPCKISRDSRKRKLLNRREAKNYKMVYTKRRILPNLDTLPFGFF